jgi:hypothetical protein
MSTEPIAHEAPAKTRGVRKALPKTTRCPGCDGRTVLAFKARDGSMAQYACAECAHVETRKQGTTSNAT